MAGELDVGSIVLQIRADAAGLKEGLAIAKNGLDGFRQAADDVGNHAAALQNKLALLEASYRKQEAAVKAAENAYKQIAAEKGASSKEAQKAETALIRETAALQGLSDKMLAARQSADAFVKAQDDSAQAAKQAADSVQSASAVQVAAYAALAAAAVKAMAAVVGAINTGIEASNRYKAAVIGLESVASGRGIASGAMTQALDKVTDAFFDAASASTAFKNLLARGYDLDQATQAIVRLKDAASFGRQASLGLAEAVVTATEGLKNENSVLVDNAGVTKNVAKMWEDYAKSIGVATTSLTQQQKIEAEVKGILEETRFQVGDLAKLQDTLAGAQARTAMAGEELTRAYGNAMAPAVQAVTEVLGGFLNSLTELIKAAPGVVSGVTSTGMAILGLMAASKAAAAIKTLQINLAAATTSATIFGISVQTAMPWLIGISMAVGLASAVWTEHSRAQQQAAEEVKKHAEAEETRQKALRDSVGELRQLRDRYAELSQKTRLTYAESQELRAIEQQLAEQFGITGSALVAQGEQYDALTGKINETILAKLKEIQIDKERASQAAVEGLQTARAEAAAAESRVNQLGRAIVAMDAYNKAVEARAKAMKDYGYGSTEFQKAWDEEQRLLGEMNTRAMQQGLKYADRNALQAAFDQALEGARTAIETRGVAVVDAVQALMAEAAGAMRIGGVNVSDATERIVNNLFEGFAKADPRISLDALMDAYEDALLNMDLSGAVEAMGAINGKIWAKMDPSDADLEQIERSFTVIETFARRTAEALGLSTEETLTMMQRLAPVGSHLITSMEGLSGVPKTIIAEWKSQNLADTLQKEGQALADAIEETNKAVQDQVRILDALGAKYKGESDIISGLRKLVEGFESESPKLIQASKDALRAIGYDAPQSLQEAKTALDNRLAIQEKYKLDMAAQFDAMSKMKQKYLDHMAALEAEGKQGGPTYTSFKAFVAMVESAQYKADQAMKHAGLTGIGEDELNRINAATAEISVLQKELDLLDKSAEKNAERIREINERIAALKIIQEGLLTGDTDSKMYQDALKHMKGLEEFSGLTLDNLETINDVLGMQQTILAASTAMLGGDLAQIQAYVDTLKERLSTMEEGSDKTILQGLVSSMEMVLTSYQGLANLPSNLPFTQAFDMSTASAEELQEELDRLTRGLKTLGAEMEKRRDLSTTYTEIKRVAEAQKAGKASAQEWARAQENYTKIMGSAAGSAEEMANAMTAAINGINNEMSGFESQGQMLSSNLTRLVSYINSARPELGINTGPAVAALNTFIGIYNAIARVLGLPTIGGASARGGGGGGGKTPFQADLEQMAHDVAMGRLELEGELKRLEALEIKYRDRRGRSTLKQDDQRDLDERLYKAREDLRRKALEDDYASLEHRKALNQLSLSEELRLLESIKASHKLNAEELREIEEKLHDARQRLKDERYEWDVALLDHQKAMGELSVDAEISRLKQIQAAHELSTDQQYALDERLYSLRKQLLDSQEGAVKTAYRRITEALKNQLQEQRDAELRALDERIAALDKLTQAENEAQRQDDHQQQLADKQRELSVTKSARRRRELTAEIANMEAAEELRLRQAARQTEKEALQQQKQAISDKYAELTREENLRQEALRLVMSNNLEQMTELIKSYGSEWQDAGAQLAKALSEGIIGGGAGILGSLANLENRIQDSINSQLRMIGQSIPSLPAGGIVIHMNGLTVREEADVDRVAGKIYDRIRAAGR